MRVLLTGFNQFGGLPYNPTQLIVEELENRKKSFTEFELVTSVLPTEFQKAGLQIEELLLRLSPDIVVLTGVSTIISIPILEMVALNIDHSELPDNAGKTPKTQLIKPDGKEAYISDVSFESLVDYFNRIGIEMGISYHAGTFVCNHVYYIAKYFIEKNKLKTSCSFVHVPFLTIESSLLSKNNNLTLLYMLDVFQKLLSLLVNSVNQVERTNKTN